MAGKHIARLPAALGAMALGVVLTLMLASCGGGGSQSMSISQGTGFFSLSAAQVAMVTQCTQRQPQNPALPTSSAASVAPLVVDAGPCAYYPSTNSVGPISAAQDVIYTTVTICPSGIAPPSSSCQTIDHVQVDTGSVGLRILASAMNSTVLQTLPAVSSGGLPVNDCYAYADGWTWGVLRTADVWMGGYNATTGVSQGVRAPGISVDIIGDPASGPISATAQSQCSGGSPSENSVATFGANGILGVMPAQYEYGSYYTCTASGGCNSVNGSVLPAQEANNPVYSLASAYDNGIVVALPPLTAGPAVNAAGTLTFGVTSTGGVNNATKFFAADVSSGLPLVQSTILSESPTPIQWAPSGSAVSAIFDTGTSFLSIYGTGMPATQDSYQWLIPSSPVTVNLSIQGAMPNTGSNTTGQLVVQPYPEAVSVTSEQTLSSQYPYPTYWAFDDLAANSSTPQDVWGAPFFFGKTMYVVYQGSFPQGRAPFYAY